MTAAVLYVCIFAAAYALLFSGSEYLFSDTSDINAFYYPALKDLREFYKGLLSGEASVINFDRLFGIDCILNAGYVGNPLYFPVVFFEGDSLLYFYKIYFISLMFLAGAAFIYMCASLGKSPITAALVTPLYLFCPFVLNFGIWFLCYTPNFISMPMMIAGMDRVFKKKGSGLLLVTALLTCLCCGVYFFFYNVVLTVIYAFVRVIFMEGEAFGKRLLIFGTKGGISVIIGFMIAGVFMLPQLSGVFSSGRVSSADSEVLSEMTMFSTKSLQEIFCSDVNYISLGFLQCVLAMLFLISRRSDKVMKILFALCVTGICIPIMSAALNAFTYIEHRWLFGFSLLAAYAYLCVICDLKNFTKTERILSGAVLTVMILGVDYFFSAASLAAALVIVVLANIPPVYRFLEKKITETDEKHPNIIELIMTVLAVVLIAFVMLLSLDKTVVMKCVLYFASLILIFTIGSGFKAYHYPLAMTAAFIGVLFAKGYNVPKLEDPEKEGNLYLPMTEVRDSILETEEPPVRFENSTDLTNRNVGANYGIAGNSAMFSILPGRYMTMMERSCFDMNALNAVDCVVGFDRRIPYLTVFGIDILQNYDETEEVWSNKVTLVSRKVSPEDELPFGFERYSEYDGNGRKYALYKNKYALPFGFTYKNSIAESERIKENGADYGINMLYGAALEDSFAETLPIERISPVCSNADFTITESRELLGENKDEYITYVLTLDEPVTDGEIYLNLQGVPHDDMYSTVKATVDSGAVTLGELYNVASFKDFKWAVMLDNYTLRLRNVKGEPVTVITVVSSMEIEGFEVSVLPHEEFVSRYNELNEYTMKNVTFGNDAVSGEISVPDNRMLVMSMQYNEGWEAYDNGERVSTYPVNDCMTGIMLTAGEHSITLKYTNRYLYIGTVLSAAGIIAAVIMLVLEKKPLQRKMKNDKDSDI